MASTSLRREFKFSILVPAADYYPQAGAEEQVLLQGVVDCCFETLEGITVVDFKTDRVDRSLCSGPGERSTGPQLAAYSRALEEITGKPVIRQVPVVFRPGSGWWMCEGPLDNLKNFSKKQLQFRFSCAILS